MRLLPAGPSALLVELGSVAEALALYAEARRARPLDLGGPAEMVPAARTVLFDAVADPARLRGWLAERAAGHRADREASAASPVGGPDAERVVEVPTVYDGADLGSVARLWDMTAAEVVATHTATSFLVAFCGFAPGFAYCTGLPAHLSVPRLGSPRSRVPAGSVAVAGEFTGVYPTASPGGWRLIGRTALVLWDPGAEEPGTLVPGARVRFVEVSR
jgi:KipI family sensor histidine kinase inhibitor